jgi:hypothetical protein
MPVLASPCGAYPATGSKNAKGGGKGGKPTMKAIVAQTRGTDPSETEIRGAMLSERR